VKRADKENNIELIAQPFGAHFPKIENPKVHVIDADDRLYQVGLLDNLYSGIKAHNLGTEKRALHGPKPGVASNIQNALALETALLGLKDVRHEMPKNLKSCFRVI